MPSSSTRLHEEVGNPVGEVQVVGSARLIAGVVAHLEEGFDIGVPGLEVDAAGALALAALIDRGDRCVERAQPGDDAVREAVGGTDERALGTDAMEGEADAAGEFREQRDLLVGVVDRFERVVRRIEQIAGGHLRVLRAAVEERRRAGQIVVRGEQVVEVDGLVDALGEAAGDAHEEVLRRLDDLARDGMPQQIAVVDGAQAEVFEAIGEAVVDGVVELAGVGGDELRGCL